jgi:uncharacterized OB-fold protein
MTTEVRGKPLPDRQDIDNGAFWTGTDAGRLQVKHCRTCSRHHWPPRLGCPFCGSGEIEWADVAPLGTAFSWVVIHRSQTPGFETDVPYTVVLVELAAAKGVRMVGNLVNCRPDQLKAGLALQAVFAPSGDGSVKLVNWQPADPA